MKSKSLLYFCLFNCVLSLFRVYYSGVWSFVYFNWNLFLAIVPLMFARLLEKNNCSIIWFWVLFAGWFLFFPNAPYMITDFFYLNRNGHNMQMPIWFDVILISSFAINGLLFGFVSAQEIFMQMQKKISSRASYLIMLISLMSSGYGVCLGRFGNRFNSWDIVTKPHMILIDMSKFFMHPMVHIKFHLLSLLVGFLVSIIFYSLHETVVQQHQ